MKRSEIMAQFALYNYIYVRVKNKVVKIENPTILEDGFFFELPGHITFTYDFRHYGHSWAFRPEDIK